MRRNTLGDAVKKVNQAGALLVFPLRNQDEPASLWKAFFPKTRMRWEWDDSGDSRVVGLWHLREELSRSKKVVYCKWFKNRATFFSLELVVYFLSALSVSERRKFLSRDALLVLSELELSSPLSSKALRQRTFLTGKPNESRFQRALKELWEGLFIVGFGEIDDGAFPSLAIGATETLFPTQWAKALDIPAKEALSQIQVQLGHDAPFYQEMVRILRKALRVASKTESNQEAPPKVLLWKTLNPNDS